MNDRVFSKRTLLWLLVIGMLSFAGAFVASIYQDKIVQLSSYGANSYSESAVGHKAFVKLLQKMNFRTRISREIRGGFNFSDAKLVIEPQSVSGLSNTLTGFSGVGSLIVLPKWNVRPDLKNNRWIREMELRHPGQVQSILNYVGNGLNLVRNDTTLTAENFIWDSELFPLDQQLSVLAPQLIVDNPGVLRPLVYNDQGVLLAEVIRSDFFYDIDRTWVLSDPDILSNHGLDNGGNAAFMIRVVDELTHGRAGGVIIDETSHGYVAEPSLWQKMFEFPFAVVTLLVAVSVIFLAWSSFSRFGAPDKDEKEYQVGKEFLIGNTAELLAFGGHGALMLKQYTDRSLQSVALKLHAPKNINTYELLEWLDRVGGARGIDLRGHDVIRAAEDLCKANTFNVLAAIRAAQNIHRWKQEMLYGTG
ncbi:hypothetical protein [Kiloniella sp.]|uniref:hypothetical protein n=1 Tax=Kiloniella sp. TaxID=1938587 RepID=UPI003A9598D8